MDKKYFILNKRQDYKDGSSYGLKFDDSGIWLDRESGGDYGAFISKLYDSREDGMIWSHMLVNMQMEEKTSIRISLYASESDRWEWNGRPVNIRRVLTNEDGMLRDKLEWMKPFYIKSVSDVSHALLFDVQARYVWLVAEFFRKGEKTPKINDITLYFPKKTWLGYLPEVYQMDENNASFLERYLSIFQLLYDDMDQKIQGSIRDFDTEAAGDEYLALLAKWLGMERTYVWTREKLRKFLGNAIHHYKIRGTVKSVEDWLDLYLGEKPYIIEIHKLETFKEEEKHYALLNQLYGDDPFCFTVLIKDNGVLLDRDHKTILSILNDVKPAYMEAHVVVIRPYIFLDSYSYLGINSVLGSYRPLSLDERSMMPFTILTGGQVEKTTVN